MSSKREKPPTFMDLYLNGTVSPEDIDDYVDKWRTSAGTGEIYEFLGMSEQEYSLWLRDPDALPHIARARRESKPLVSVIDSALKKTAVAAPPSDEEKRKRLKRWLKQQAKSA